MIKFNFCYIIKKNPLFDETKCHPFVCDITNTKFEYPFQKASLDCILSIFVLSSIPPELYLIFNIDIRQ